MGLYIYKAAWIKTTAQKINKLQKWERQEMEGGGGEGKRREEKINNKHLSYVHVPAYSEWEYSIGYHHLLETQLQSAGGMVWLSWNSNDQHGI